MAKIEVTKRQANAMVRRHSKGESFAAIGKRFGVSAKVASRLVKEHSAKLAEARAKADAAKTPDPAPPVDVAPDPVDVAPAKHTAPDLRTETKLTPAEALAQVSRVTGRPIQDDCSPYGDPGDAMIVDIDNRKHVRVPRGLLQVRDHKLRRRVRWAVGIAGAAGCEIMQITAPRGTRLSVNATGGKIVPVAARKGESFKPVEDGEMHPKTGEAFPPGTFRIYQDGEPTERFAIPVGERADKPNGSAKPAVMPDPKYLALTVIQLRRLCRKAGVDGYSTLSASAAASLLTEIDATRKEKRRKVRKAKRAKRGF